MKNTLKFMGAVALSTASLCTNSANYEVISIEGRKTGLYERIELQDQTDVSADFADTLEAITGLSINRNGPVTAVLQYRGLLGDHIPVRFNGVGIAGAGPNAMDSPLSHIMSVPNAKIIKHTGVAPVSAGPETLTSSLNITQDIAWQRPTNSQLVLKTTDNGTAKYIKAQTEQNDTTKYFSAMGFYQSGNESDNGAGIQRSQSFYERYGAQGQFAVRQTSGEWVGRLQHQYTGASGTAALNMDINFIAATWARLSYTMYDLGEGELTVTAYGNRNTHDMDNFSLRTLSTPVAARLNSVDSELHGLQVTWGQEEWDTGLQWQTQTHNSLITNPNNENFALVNFNHVKRSRANGYLEYNWEDNAQRLSLGVQPTYVAMQAQDISHHMQQNQANIQQLVNDFNSADKDLSWQFVDIVGNYQKRLSSTLDWFVDAGIKHKAPSYTQVYVWFPLGISGGLADGNNYIGNLDLTQERAYSVNSGLLWQLPSLELKAQVYLSNINDYITGQPSENMTANMLSNMLSNKTPLQWTNVDAQLYGLEVDVVYQINHQQLLTIQASTGFGKNRDTDEYLFRMAPAKVFGQWQIKHHHWEHSISQTLVLRQTNISTLHNETPSPSYALTDISSTYQVNKGLQVTLAVNNVFAKHYQAHLAGVNRVPGAEPTGERLSGLGRTVSLSMAYQF